MPIAQVVGHTNLPLIEAADKITLDIILNDDQARRMIVTRLSERVAVVAPGQVDALLARLVKLGHLPKVLDE